MPGSSAEQPPEGRNFILAKRGGTKVIAIYPGLSPEEISDLPEEIDHVQRHDDESMSLHINSEELVVGSFATDEALRDYASEVALRFGFRAQAPTDQNVRRLVEPEYQSPFEQLGETLH